MIGDDRAAGRQEVLKTLIMNPIALTVMQHPGNQSAGYELSFW